MSELMQAAERLREVERTGNGCMVYKCPADEAVNAMQRDEAAVIDEYLRLTDPTPIDRVWLRHVGFEMDYADMQVVRRFGEYSMMSVVLTQDGYWFVGGGSTSHQSLARVESPKSRGQLRMLCAAFEIELKE